MRQTPSRLPHGAVLFVNECVGHTPVLVRAVSELLAVVPGDTVVDATVGSGGHARLFADAIGPDGTLIAIDVDPQDLSIAERSLADAPCRVELVRANFATIGEVLQDLGVSGVDVLFADLGVSSTQLDDPERGLSFQQDGPLDMRLDSGLKVTATDLINGLRERELADLFFYNAQEVLSRRIARRICDARRDKRITTTQQLAAVVAAAVGGHPTSRKSKIHPATRTFMALRIAVNSEKESLDKFLDAAPALLRPGGRIGVIAFHSGEDRPVKLDFRKRKNDKVYRVVTKKPVVADAEERRANPRSRSAKLRVAIRIAD